MKASLVISVVENLLNLVITFLVESNISEKGKSANCAVLYSSKTKINFVVVFKICHGN